MPRPRTHRVSALAAFAVLISTPLPGLLDCPTGLAHAQSASSLTAQEHAQRGQRLYRAGQFEEALAAYVSAYESSLDPDYLLDIAKCHRRLGQYEAAVFFYQGYLAWRPDGAARAEVERAIEETQASQVAAGAAPSPPVWKRGWFWGLLTGGTLVAGGAATALVLSLQPAPPPRIPMESLEPIDGR